MSSTDVWFAKYKKYKNNMNISEYIKKNLFYLRSFIFSMCALTTFHKISRTKNNHEGMVELETTCSLTAADRSWWVSGHRVCSGAAASQEADKV